MPRRSLREIPFPLHLSCILSDRWKNVMRDAGWRVLKGPSNVTYCTKNERIESSSKGYTGETRRSKSKFSARVTAQGQVCLCRHDAYCKLLQLPPKYGAFLVAFLYIRLHYR